jgi:hypothetical protein
MSLLFDSKESKTNKGQNGMMFNDRRKTRIQSAKERQRVHNLVRDTGAFISSRTGEFPASRKEQYAQSAQAVDTVIEANRKKKK